MIDLFEILFYVLKKSCNSVLTIIKMKILRCVFWDVTKMVSTLEPPVMIQEGDSIHVEGKGSCHLPNGTTIKGVLLVPKFSCNLLSVSRLLKDHQCSVAFFTNFCFMQDLHLRELIAMGKCKHGIY